MSVESIEQAPASAVVLTQVASDVVVQVFPSEAQDPVNVYGA